MQLQLYVEGAENSVYLDLPAAPADVDKIYAEFDENSRENRRVDIIGVSAPIHGLSQYIAKVNVTNAEDLEKLNTLAKRIDQMEDRERSLFAGALGSETVNGLEDVLRISEHLDDYILFPDVLTDTDLGRYLVSSGYKNFPEYVRPYLNYRGIGIEYYAEQGGAYGPGGYVRRKTAEEQTAQERPGVINVYLRPLGPDNTMKPHRLSLPATDAALDRAKCRLDIDSFSDAFITRIEFADPRLEALIPRDGFRVEDADELAYSIEEMQRKDGEFMKYLAVLSVMRPQTLTDALDLAMDLDDFEQVADDIEEYGRQALRRYETPDEIIEAINGYMDFETFGVDAISDDGVRRTEYGSIRRCSSPLPKKVWGQENVTMIKLYMPLKAELFYYNEDDGDYDMSGDGIPQDGKGLLSYKPEIQAELVACQLSEEAERGLMHWYADRDDADKNVDEKVRAAIFNAEERGGQLWGVAECWVAGKLTPGEMTTLKDYIRGQASDGWGEGFAQEGIRIGEGEGGAILFVHLWSSEDGWAIMTEEERFGPQAENEMLNTMQMGGM